MINLFYISGLLLHDHQPSSGTGYTGVQLEVVSTEVGVCLSIIQIVFIAFRGVFLHKQCRLGHPPFVMRGGGVTLISVVVDTGASS